MTRKHFQAIADAFKNNKPDGYQREIQWLKDIEAMANTLVQFNPRFDRAAFIDACKGE